MFPQSEGLKKNKPIFKEKCYICFPKFSYVSNNPQTTNLRVRGSNPFGRAILFNSLAPYLRLSVSQRGELGSLWEARSCLRRNLGASHADWDKRAHCLLRPSFRKSVARTRAPCVGMRFLLIAQPGSHSRCRHHNSRDKFSSGEARAAFKASLF